MIKVPSVLLALSVASSIASAIEDTSVPLPPNVTATAGRAIDQALQMSEFFKQGMHRRLMQLLTDRDDKTQVVSCFDTKIGTITNDTFIQIITQGLTPAQIQRGGELAASPVFAKVTTYIRENQVSLTAEPKSPEIKMDDFFLMTAATRLALSTEEKRTVEDFVVWHQSVQPFITNQVKQRIPKLIQVIAKTIEECHGVKR